MFEHQRHKPPTLLERPRPLVLACPDFRSKINFSRIVRAAACSGVTRIVTSGNGKVAAEIARDGVDHVAISTHRSLIPQLKKLKADGMHLVGLEQATDSTSLPDYSFERDTVLVIGHERHGIDEQTLQILNAVVEIPVFGLPYSFNVATATAMALYEYCRQFPAG